MSRKLSKKEDSHSIDIDCYSLNFTKRVREIKTFFTGEVGRRQLILPMTSVRQGAIIRFVESYEPVGHDEAGPIVHVSSGGGRNLRRFGHSRPRPTCSL